WRVGDGAIIARSGGGADGAGVAGAPDGGGADDGAGVGGLDHQALADVHADVVDGAGVAGVVGEEDQVAGDQVERVDRAHAGVGGELGAGDPGDGDPGGGVGEAGQAGAVEGAGAVGSPDVGGAELGEGDGDRLAGGRRGTAVADRGGAGGAGAGQVVGEGA